MKDLKIIFESENIYYVNVSELFIDDYLKMFNNPNIQKFLSHKLKQFTYEQELEWVNTKLREQAYIYTMIEKGTYEFIGNIEIMNVRDGIGEIAITITVDKQNKHYGAESIKEIVAYGCKRLQISTFDLNVYKTNIRAIKCYEKAGFFIDDEGKTKEDFHMTYGRKIIK